MARRFTWAQGWVRGREPSSLTWWRWSAAVALGCFLLFGLRAIPTLGFEDDELIFVNLFFHPNDAFSRLPLGGEYALPAMAASYAGALKTWVWSPLLLAAGYPGVWAVRLPAVLLSAFVIVLLGSLLTEVSGGVAGAAIVMLLSTDGLWLYTSTFDWGPVVLQQLLLVTALLLTWRFAIACQHRWLFAGGLALGLALWDKAVLVWQISGLVAALAVVGRPILQSHATKQTWIRFGQGFIVGAFPLWLANLRHHFATFKDNGHYLLSGIPAKTIYMWHALDGQAAVSFLVEGPAELGNSWRFEAGLLMIAAALLLARDQQRRLVLFFLISGIVGWLQSAATLHAGDMPHHVVLFWVNWYGALAVSVGVLLASRWKVGATILLAALVIRGGQLEALDLQALKTRPTTSRWTNADVALADSLRRAAVRRTVVADWGIRNVLRVRSGDRITVENQSVELMLGHFNDTAFENCAIDSGCVVVRHAKNRDVFPNAAQTLQHGLANYQCVQETVYDPHGIAAFEILRLRSHIGGGR